MHTRALRIVAVTTVLGALLAAPSVAGAATLFGSGSSASVPYLDALFKGYKKVKPNIKFVYTPNGGNAGVVDVQSGKSQFAIQTRPPLPSDKGTTYAKLFLDGLCIAVNPSNHLSGLRVSQVKDVFLANVTSWSAFPASGLSTTIAPFGRVTTAGLYTFFQSSVLDGATQATNVVALEKDGEVAVAVRKNPNAIGYVGLANAGKKSGVKALKLNNQPCAAKAIKKLKYPLTRYAWIVLPTKKPNKAVQKFADWVRTSYAAGKIIAKVGGVPAFNATKPPKKHRG